ncbi:hypothetical protein TRFO_20197 [Tritrichomonas foetus]|uniref:PCI domain-containing protein n=1 Tax=Tritrichomonas foetus TaxID=1144522 RepID=A0A1J4KHN7_9EUKA|nr:hypothetical protein TRFO_20197 [Tritrichomonas foetus]|eukprot:OHT10464.1 hypothetical protein TRFO_20197 [Tritrichomonas foetus]
MTERQRLITKYIYKLSPATSVRYQLHFLRTERDESARHMLIDSLLQIQKDTNNSELQSVINDVCKNSGASIKFGKHNQKADKIRKIKDEDGSFPRGTNGKGKQDYSQDAHSHFSALELEDALKFYDRAINHFRKTSSHVEKFYQNRAECNLCLENYKEALSLAQKGRLFDMAFVSAISIGEMEEAKKYIPPIFRSIIDNNHNKESVASTFELIHLILIVCFATYTTSETSKISSQLFSAVNFDLQNLKELTDSFCNRKFDQFVSQFSILNTLLDISLYASPSKATILQAIKQNVIINRILPLAKTQIDVLKNELKFDLDEITSLIRISIRNGRLNGKLDLVSKSYVGGIIDTEHEEMKDAFARTMSIRQNFELNLWKEEYNALVPLHQGTAKKGK